MSESTSNIEIKETSYLGIVILAAIIIFKRLNNATLDELQNVICCSNYRRDYNSKNNLK